MLHLRSSRTSIKHTLLSTLPGMGRVVDVPICAAVSGPLLVQGRGLHTCFDPRGTLAPAHIQPLVASSRCRVPPSQSPHQLFTKSLWQQVACRSDPIAHKPRGLPFIDSQVRPLFTQSLGTHHRWRRGRAAAEGPLSQIPSIHSQAKPYAEPQVHMHTQPSLVALVSRDTALSVAHSGSFATYRAMVGGPLLCWSTSSGTHSLGRHTHGCTEPSLPACCERRDSGARQPGAASLCSLSPRGMQDAWSRIQA